MRGDEAGSRPLPTYIFALEDEAVEQLKPCELKFNQGRCLTMVNCINCILE